MNTLDTLTAEYVAWNAAEGLTLGSADEHLHDYSLNNEQRNWLREFCCRWEGAVEEERRQQDAIVSQQSLSIDDDMGTETYIKTIRCGTLLGIRRAVRALNPGSLPIYSDYDCTGLVCYQSCKFLKIYKCYSGFYVAVVELCVTRDV